jgi:hypothetical protein
VDRLYGDVWDKDGEHTKLGIWEKKPGKISVFCLCSIEIWVL